MNRKPIYPGILLGILFFISFDCISQLRGDSFASANNSKIANVTYVYTGVKGFAQNQDGEVKGLLVDLMREFENYVEEKHGIKINTSYQEIQDGDFQAFLNSVRDGSGGVFGINTTTIREDRKSFLKFSPAYLNNISVLVTNRSVATLTRLNKIGTEFGSLYAVTAPGTTYEKRVLEVKSKFHPNVEIQQVPGEYDIVDRVATDENAFGFVDISFYLEYLYAKKPVKRHPVGDKGGEEYGIIMPLNSDWQPVITEFLNSGFLESPEYRQIVIGHLGKGALRMLN